MCGEWGEVVKKTATARARGGSESGLIPQPHGGAIRPFPPGNGGGTSWKAVRKQVLASLGEMTPDAVTRLKELMNSEDDRVAVVATTQILDRTLGKPGELPQVVPDATAAINVDRLTPAEQSELAAALATVRRLAEKAQGVVDV